MNVIHSASAGVAQHRAARASMIRFMGRQERGQRECRILLPAGMESPRRCDWERPGAVGQLAWLERLKVGHFQTFRNRCSSVYFPLRDNDFPESSIPDPHPVFCSQVLTNRNDDNGFLA
jgi:hypothetical protein